jgi:epoxyqueuosine reductase
MTFPEELLESLGIVDWGYTEAAEAMSFERFAAWDAGSLKYLSDHRRDLRSDVRQVYPEFQSALVFLFNYTPAKKWLLDHDRHEVAAYSVGFGGNDYHHVLKDRLRKIEEHLGVKGFISLDTHPVLERDLAFRAGLGWFGKNSMLISQRDGSYFLIGSLLLDRKLELQVRPLDVDHCGHCTACSDACPTRAIDPENRTLIADKCISTYTIEVFKDVPAPEGMEKGRGEIFGCDICQDVCPWNRKPLARTLGELNISQFLRTILFETPKKQLFEMIDADSTRGWKKKLQGTAFDRPGKAGWLKNLKAFLTSRSDP